MDQAYCPACGMDVEVVYMTLGTGVDAEEKPKCIHCGYDFQVKDKSHSGKWFNRIAIAEDMKTIRTAVREDMVSNGLAQVVDEFEDGGTFIQAVNAHSAQGQVYDLVILDLNMPTVNGLKAALFLRTMEKKLGWEPTPILFFSSVVCDQRLQENIQKLGPSMYLNKGTINKREFLPQRLCDVLVQFKQTK